MCPAFMVSGSGVRKAPPTGPVRLSGASAKPTFLKERPDGCFRVGSGLLERCRVNDRFADERRTFRQCSRLCQLSARKPMPRSQLSVLGGRRVSTHCGHSCQGYCAAVTDDLRDSLKLWCGGIAFSALFWLTLHFNLLGRLSDKVPAYWFGLAVAVLALFNLTQLGWGLWQRRASNPRNPNRR